jgi:glycogen debranching enzyme
LKGKGDTAQQSIELRLSRTVGPGLHEDVDLTNFTQNPASLQLELEMDADFADPEEAGGRRKQKGDLTRNWREFDGSTAELVFDYQVEHAYDHQGNQGVAHMHRGIRLRIEHADSPPKYHDGRISFQVELPAHASWHACLKWSPQIEGTEMTANTGCHFSGQNDRDRIQAAVLGRETIFSISGMDGLAQVVAGALEQSKRDLIALRLYDLDEGNAWVPAAGLPQYVGLFGRDALASSWQSLLLTRDMTEGALRELSKWQATASNDWRDEQPGKIVHEVHTNPLSVLNFNPHGKYYGGVTGALYVGVVASGLWHWTGDKDLVRPLVPTVLQAFQWADRYGDLDGDGFCEYLTRSEQGEKNQGWKDSDDAIVHEDGTQVEDPLGTCEMQGFLYASKLHISELLWWLDETDLAKKLFEQAQELRKRFNEAFWMEDKGYIALGLDSKKRQIRSIASDPGHCLTSGIIDEALVERVARRMMAQDLFSGWGVRTLSSEHPSFNPYAYHRGTVWPVENATFVLGFARYGLHEFLHKLSAAQFEAASLFDYYRLPEVFAGHSRDGEHPFPALYPKANWPQAWSASAVFTHLQALLGIYPYAPLNALLLDPHLPEWLPEITLGNLHVGKATIDIRFYRQPDGRSDYQVLEQRGKLHVLRQPSPWSLTSGWVERVRDAITSMLPGK